MSRACRVPRSFSRVRKRTPHRCSSGTSSTIAPCTSACSSSPPSSNRSRGYGAALGCKLKLDDVTYYVGHETVIRRDDGKGLPRVVETLFAYLQRNSMHVSDYFRLPADSVVELGREIAI